MIMAMVFLLIRAGTLISLERLPADLTVRQTPAVAIFFLQNTIHSAQNNGRKFGALLVLILAKVFQLIQKETFM